MKNKVIRILVYVLWGLFSLLVCIYLTFPTDTLADIIRAQLEARLGHRYLVRLDDLSLAGLTGITLENLWLTPIPENPQTADPSGATRGPGENRATSEGSGSPEASGGGSPPPRVFPTRVDEATITLGLLSLLRGDPEVTFEADLGDGLLYGSWKPDPEVENGHLLSVSADRVPLNSIGLLSEVAQAAVAGTLTGHLTLRYNEDQRLHAGELHFLDVEDLMRQAGPLELGQAPIFFSTPTRLGRLHAEAVLEGTDLTVNSFEALGGDVEVQIPRGGRLNLRTPFDQSYLRLTVQLLFSEEWVRNNELEGVFRNIPVLREACDGVECALAVTGPLAQIQSQPLRTRRGY